MAFTRREYQGAAPQASLAVSINATDLSITGDELSGYPTGAVGPFFIVLDESLAGEEKVLCESRVGNVITIADVSDRGADGTSAGSHTAGATINHCFTALDADEANLHATDTARDDHPQYLDAARHATASHKIGTELDDPAVAPTAVGTTPFEGTSDDAARADHGHDIADGAIDHSGLFASGVVDAAAIAANAVGSSELADNAVDTNAIADDAVTSAKIAADAVGSSEIAANAVGSSEIAADAVGNSELADDAVDSANIVDESIDSVHFNPSDALPHSNTNRVEPTALANTASTSYVNYPAAGQGGPLSVVNFVKHLDGTKLIVRVDIARVYTVTNVGRGDFAVRVDGVDNYIFSIHPAISTEVHPSGVIEIDGLAAGTYTVTLRCKSSSATTGIEYDTDSTFSMEVTETY